jgi:transposase
LLDGTFVPAQRGGTHVGYGRKGKGSTIHVVTDGNGLPLAVDVTSATVYETKPVLKLLDTIRVQGSRGRPKQLVADRAYDSMPLRLALRKRNIRPIIPGRIWKGRKRRQGRPAGSCQAGKYQGRWKIERLNAWMDNYRRVAVRWDHTLKAFKTWVILACIMICLNQF